jgi:hypothetical protein
MFGQPTSPRFRAVLAGTLSAGLVFSLAACGGDDSGGGADTDASASTIDCAPYKAFGDIKGKSVSIYTGIITPEDVPQKDSYKPFENCTGATIKYEGDKSFETQILVRAKAGNPPDLAIVPQPGLLKQLVATGKAVEAPAVVGQGLEGLRHGRRQVLRRPAGRQREVAGVVLAERVQGQRLHHPHHARRAQGAERQDRGGQEEAVVRGHQQR